MNVHRSGGQKYLTLSFTCNSFVREIGAAFQFFFCYYNFLYKLRHTAKNFISRNIENKILQYSIRGTSNLWCFTNLLENHQLLHQKLQWAQNGSLLLRFWKFCLKNGNLRSDSNISRAPYLPLNTCKHPCKYIESPSKQVRWAAPSKVVFLKIVLITAQ